MKDDDQLDNLDRAVRKQSCEEKAAEALAKARVKLVLSKDAKAVFFATLALRLTPDPDWGIETAATDGKILKYNPEFFSGLTAEEAIGVVAHEVMHNALAHHARRGHRDHKKWNIAIDCAINPLLVEAGYKLPRGGMFPKDFSLPDGLSAEEYYSQLPDQGQGEGGGGGGDGEGEGEGEGDGQGDNDPGRCGGVQDPGDGSEAACRESEAESQVAVAQATQAAKRRGSLPAGIARLVDQVLTPKVDWREQLRNFVSTQAKNDYAWFPPNRRFIAEGLYLPGLRSEELGDVCLAVDTSGSIGQAELTRFGSEIQGILDSFPNAQLTILYHDSAVAHVQQWSASDGPLVLEPKGGGGTDHCPVFDWIAERDAPTCLICLTDCYTRYPDRAPAYPVMWAVSGNKDAKPPFGQVVHIEG